MYASWAKTGDKMKKFLVCVFLVNLMKCGSGGSTFSEVGKDIPQDDTQEIKMDVTQELVVEIKDSLVKETSMDVLEIAGEMSKEGNIETNQEFLDGATEQGGDDWVETTTTDIVDASMICTNDEDCLGGNSCYLGRCEAGKCIYEKIECAPDTECFLGSCVDIGCKYEPVFSDECYTPPVVFSNDFEKLPLDQWTIIDLAENQPKGLEIIWKPSGHRAHSGSKSLYFGDPIKQNYDTGKLVASSAKSPPLTLKSQGKYVLVTWFWMDVEDGDIWDIVSISVETTDATIPVWAKKYGFPMKKWVPITVNLSAFAGKTFRIVFTFNSVEGSFNSTEGVYIDDCFVLQVSKTTKCVDDDDCDDAIPCTVDKCVGGICKYDYTEGCCSADIECDDFDACTIDLCKDGACIHTKTADPLCCNKDADCDDHNICTNDKCIKNKCQYSTSDEPGCCSKDIECDDKDPCTKDACIASQCSHINTCCKTDKDCDDKDDKCTVDSCVAGKCVYKPTGAEGCCSPTIINFDFEDGGKDWEFSAKQGNVGWQVVSGKKFISGDSALYYGDPSKWNFDNGKANSGYATSPYISLPSGLYILLTLKIFMDTEAGASYDKLNISIESEGLPTVIIWQKSEILLNQFFAVNVNLSAWAGHDVRLKITFDTVDSIANTGLGVFIDDVAFTTTCEPLTCTDDIDCKDGINNTTEKCNGGVCSYEISNQVGCITDDDCDDFDDCTYDYCTGGKCNYIEDPFCGWWE